MTYHVSRVRAHFPSLDGGTAYVDEPGGTQTPDVVADAVRSTLVGPLSNHGTVSAAERNAEDDAERLIAALGEFARNRG